MGLLDALLGRSTPVQPDLDQLFAVPVGRDHPGDHDRLRPRPGWARSASGPPRARAFASLQREVQTLLDADAGPPVEREPRTPTASPGCWPATTRAESAALVTDLHAVNTTLADHGFGPQLLCSLVGLRRRRPGARSGSSTSTSGARSTRSRPAGDQRRDNALELQVRGALVDDLPIEPDLTRWFPVWGAPGLGLQPRVSPAGYRRRP